MNGLKEMLENEVQHLTRIKSVVDKRLLGAPEGTLRITKSNNCIQYKQRIDSESKEIHIKKENITMAQQLAQKGYDQKVLKLVTRRLKQLEKVSEEYNDREIEELYNNLHPVRKMLIKPVETPWEQRLENWRNTPYVGKEFAENIPVIYTKKGERVRSKSEKILADTFNDLGIDYKYECPIKLRGVGVVYPDFTFLRERDGKEIYWEHYGRMDDPEYAEKAVRKTNAFMANKIFPGDNLILSYESTCVVLNDRIVRMMIEKYIV
jgi:hypothetical protein